jgi:hypothetical protein
MNGDFQLQRNAFGRLVFTGVGGEREEDVEVVRAFPVSAPGEGAAVVNREGRELAWIPRLDALPGELRGVVEEALAGREFMPEIRRVRGVSGYAVPCIWQVETDRGETSFTLKAEEDIRRMAAPCLMITDSRGIQFLVRDPRRLDTASRRILERFL